MPNVDDFAADAVNEITPANLRSLVYWLAGVIITVTLFISGVYWDDLRDQEKHQSLRNEVQKISTAIGKLNDFQIRAEVERDNIRRLAAREQNDTDRRFMEIMQRIDQIIDRI